MCILLQANGLPQVFLRVTVNAGHYILVFFLPYEGTQRLVNSKSIVMFN